MQCAHFSTDRLKNENVTFNVTCGCYFDRARAAVPRADRGPGVAVQDSGDRHVNAEEVAKVAGNAQPTCLREDLGRSGDREREKGIEKERFRNLYLNPRRL